MALRRARARDSISPPPPPPLKEPEFDPERIRDPESGSAVDGKEIPLRSHDLAEALRRRR